MGAIWSHNYGWVNLYTWTYSLQLYLLICQAFWSKATLQHHLFTAWATGAFKQFVCRLYSLPYHKYSQELVCIKEMRFVTQSTCCLFLSLSFFFLQIATKIGLIKSSLISCSLRPHYMCKCERGYVFEPHSGMKNLIMRESFSSLPTNLRDNDCRPEGAVPCQDEHESWKHSHQFSQMFPIAGGLTQ